MKKFIIVLMYSLIFYASCRYETDKEILIKKAQYFDSIGYKTFNGFNIGRLRKGKNASYQVSKFDTPGDYAIIKLYPDSKIEKNFRRDSIDLTFTEKFKALDCYYLVCKDNFVRIDCQIGKYRYVLYRGAPFKSIYLPGDTTLAKPLDGNWSFFEFDLRGK